MRQPRRPPTRTTSGVTRIGREINDVSNPGYGAILSMVQGTLLQTESCLKSQKWSPYKVKVPFSTPVCTRKQKDGPSSADQSHSIASCNSRHAQSAKAVHLPTSPCPTLSASAEPIFKTGCTNWCAVRLSLSVGQKRGMF